MYIHYITLHTDRLLLMDYLFVMLLGLSIGNVGYFLMDNNA